MRNILVLFLFLFFVISAFGQVRMSAEIQQIINKMSTGKELTEAEEAKLEQWSESLENQNVKSVNKTSSVNKTTTKADLSLCPPKIPLDNQTELSREKYVQLAQSLMTTYGSKTGDLLKIKQILQQSSKKSDGSDLGAAFVMTGAGSASVYAIAWSAAQEPDDILTANNLGVALKDMGEHAKAIQVLKYADKLKPNIGLILCNLGWAYREAGDYANARIMFEKALKASPEMDSPNLGLGLIEKCENNNLQAAKYLRKTLKNKYSAVGFGALKQAEAAQSNNDQKPEPLTDKKDNAESVPIPDLPIYEQIGKTSAQLQPIGEYMSKLDFRTQQLISELNSTIELIKKQQAHAQKTPDNAILFSRDFSKEIMMYSDVTELLFGENSNYAKISKDRGELMHQDHEMFTDPFIINKFDELEKYNKQLDILFKEFDACGEENVDCQKRVSVKIATVQAQSNQVLDQICKKQKSAIEVIFSDSNKSFALMNGALKEAITDYFAFTDPILENIYAPSLNKLYNIQRELQVTSRLKVMAGYAAHVAELGRGYNELKCAEPQSETPDAIDEPALPTQNKKDCPLGKDGLKAAIGVLSFELSCNQVKLSGGEGVLWSVKRDFNKHETTIWGGVGVKKEFGNNLSGEATVGAEITFGQGDAVKDVAFTSSVKAGLGGLVENEISGRFSLEGGPSVETSANMITPGLSDIMGQ